MAIYSLGSEATAGGSLARPLSLTVILAAKMGDAASSTFSVEDLRPACVKKSSSKRRSRGKKNRSASCGVSSCEEKKGRKRTKRNRTRKPRALRRAVPQEAPKEPLNLESMEAFPCLEVSQVVKETRSSGDALTCRARPLRVTKIDLEFVRGDDGFTRVTPVVQFEERKAPVVVQSAPRGPLNFLAAIQRIGKYGVFKFLRSIRRESPRAEVSAVAEPAVVVPVQQESRDEVVPIPRPQSVREPKIRPIRLPRVMRKINYRLLSAAKNSKTTGASSALKLKKTKQHRSSEKSLTLYPVWHFAANWVASETETFVRRKWRTKRATN